jgi:hypothetical protein
MWCDFQDIVGGDGSPERLLNIAPKYTILTKECCFVLIRCDLIKIFGLPTAN